MYMRDKHSFWKMDTKQRELKEFSRLSWIRYTLLEYSCVHCSGSKEEIQRVELMS